MKKLFLFFIATHFSFSAMGAKTQDYWLNVESETSKKQPENKKTYPYDSLESQAPKQHFQSSPLWSLDSKLTLGLGFQPNQSFFKRTQSDLWFLNTGLHFRNRPWHRFKANMLLLQNNSLILSCAWEYLPSRKSLRHYYGGGIANVLISQKEFNNLVEPTNYFVTAHAGLEYLLESRDAISAEVKGLWNTHAYALQISVNYIIPL